MTQTPSLDRLLAIMALLRDPVRGCPWDIKQTFDTIAPYTIEEAYEVLSAINSDDMGELKEELGDLLLQVVFHARIAEEEGHFAFEDVAEAIVAKLERRHPHIFGQEKGLDEAKVKANWDKIKQEEKAAKKGATASSSILSDIPQSLPSLIRAQKLQEKAAKVGFDWPDAQGALDKIKEEIEELSEAIKDNIGGQDIAAEIGDLLFSISNLSRKLNLSSEVLLNACNDKFTRRFNYIEDKIKSKNEDITSKTLDQLDSLWVEAKKKLG